MVNALAIYKEAKELGSTKTFSEVQALISGFDYQSLCEAERQRYQISIWDKQTSINGVSPEIIADGVPQDGSVYLIYVDGNLVYLQKHDPEQMGFVAMDDSTAMNKANLVVDSLVQNNVDAFIKNEVLIASLS